MSDRFIWRQKSEALAAVMEMLGGYVPAAKTAAADVRSVAARGATAVLMDPETGALDAALSAAPEMLACTLAASNESLVGFFGWGWLHGESAWPEVHGTGDVLCIAWHHSCDGSRRREAAHRHGRCAAPYDRRTREAAHGGQRPRAPPET